MKWKKIAALGLIGLAGLTGVGYAYQGTPGVPGPNCTIDETVHTTLQTAIENGDYTTFQQLKDEYDIAKGRIWSIIDTPEEFQLFSELHKAVTSGDVEKAMELRQELGLPLGGQYGHASGPRDGTGFQHRGRGPHGTGTGNGTGSKWGQ